MCMMWSIICHVYYLIAAVGSRLGIPGLDPTPIFLYENVLHEQIKAWNTPLLSKNSVMRALTTCM